MNALPLSSSLARDFRGQTLDKLCREPMEVTAFLRYAARIAGALAELHQACVVHKNIKPQSILLDSDTGEVRIIDMRLAVRLPRDAPAARGTSVLEGTLAYISPEQTGRINRSVDARTALYSLGVTFYEMLTGKLPFQVSDPLEWVHCHLARVPPPPTALRKEIPGPLSDIVMKLLSKAAEDRYQSAHGLKLDLEACLARWLSAGSIDPFPLGARDVAGQVPDPAEAVRPRGGDPALDRRLRSRGEVQEEYEQVQKNLGGRPIEALLELPLMTDPNMRAAMRILSALWAPALSTDANLTDLSTGRIVNLCLQYGNTDAATMGYAVWGTTLINTFHQYREGHRFGKLAHDLMAKHGFVAYEAMLYFQLHDFHLYSALLLSAVPSSACTPMPSSLAPASGSPPCSASSTGTVGASGQRAPWARERHSISRFDGHRFFGDNGAA